MMLLMAMCVLMYGFIIHDLVVVLMGIYFIVDVLMGE